MSTQPLSLRPSMVPLAGRVRAYCAPVDREAGSPTIFDPAREGLFSLDAPPAPWLDLGWIENLHRSAGTRVRPLRGGGKGSAVGQFRQNLEARVEFDFREWGKLQMALAGGSQHMNALAADPGGSAAPSGGTALPAVPLQAGSTAMQLVVGAAAVSSFSVGDIVAVDDDYASQTGYVGSGLAAAYVRDPADVSGDADYIRRVTFNLGRVASITTDALLLAQPLLGGVPLATAAVQRVIAFLDREGGSFFQEWSALFVIPEDSGGRICFYYPRLQPTGAPESITDAGVLRPQEAEFQVGAPLEGHSLRAMFLALPASDPNDSEEVVCYRSYFPAASAALY